METFASHFCLTLMLNTDCAYSLQSLYICSFSADRDMNQPFISNYYDFLIYQTKYSIFKGLFRNVLHYLLSKFIRHNFEPNVKQQPQFCATICEISQSFSTSSFSKERQFLQSFYVYSYPLTLISLILLVILASLKDPLVILKL